MFEADEPAREREKMGKSKESFRRKRMTAFSSSAFLLKSASVEKRDMIAVRSTAGCRHIADPQHRETILEFLGVKRRVLHRRFAIALGVFRVVKPHRL